VKRDFRVQLFISIMFSLGFSFYLFFLSLSVFANSLNRFAMFHALHLFLSACLYYFLDGDGEKMEALSLFIQSSNYVPGTSKWSSLFSRFSL
jgi:hypothetical protein